MSSTSPLRSSLGSSLARLPRLPAAADAALGRARLTVVPTLRSRAPKMPFVTLVSVLLLGGVVGLLLFNTSMQQASFQAAALQTRADTLDAQQQALQSRVDALDDPQHVARLATHQGMVIAPACTATVDLDRARVTGQCPAATRADALPIMPPPVAAPPAQVVQVPTDPVAPSATTSPKQKSDKTGKSDKAGKSGKAGKNSSDGAAPQRGGQQAQTGSKHR